MTSGGHRTPSHSKAVVSGPGRYSRRSDGQSIAQLPNAKYGEQQQFQADQHSAPMSATPPVGPPTAGGAAPAAPTPLLAPTQRPWEEGTAPAAPVPVGGTVSQTLSDVLAKYVSQDVTGDLQALYQNALQRGM